MLTKNLFCLILISQLFMTAPARAKIASPAAPQYLFSVYLHLKSLGVPGQSQDQPLWAAPVDQFHYASDFFFGGGHPEYTELLCNYCQEGATRGYLITPNSGFNLPQWGFGEPFNIEFFVRNGKVEYTITYIDTVNLSIAKLNGKEDVPVAWLTQNGWLYVNVASTPPPN